MRWTENKGEKIGRSATQRELRELPVMQKVRTREAERKSTGVLTGPS